MFQNRHRSQQREPEKIDYRFEFDVPQMTDLKTEIHGRTSSMDERDAVNFAWFMVDHDFTLEPPASKIKRCNTVKPSKAKEAPQTAKVNLAKKVVNIVNVNVGVRK